MMLAMAKFLQSVALCLLSIMSRRVAIGVGGDGKRRCLPMPTTAMLVLTMDGKCKVMMVLAVLVVFSKTT